MMRRRLLTLCAAFAVRDGVAGRAIAGAEAGTRSSARCRSPPTSELHAATERAAASRRVAVRQRQRRVDAGEVQGVGLGAREIERFDVLFPTPKERRLEMVEPTKFTAKLEEPAVAVDPTTGQKTEQLPSYNAYSIDGDVTAPLVYVNYGRVEDYEQLDRLGISVRGAIVIARYGGLARHQAEGRGRARRGRLPDLLGPAGTMGTRWAPCFRTARCGRATACSAAA